jgi:4-hydroxy-tetrahydrodipicolinate synthase
MADADGETDLQGLWVPLVTPFDSDDEVDVGALERLARRVLGDGAHGIVALGTTGEPATLTADEQRRVIETCRAVCDEMARPLIVGGGTNSTRSTVAAVQALSGVRGALVVVPYYTRPTPAGIVEHFRVVASESPIPIVAYNVPYRTGRELSAGDILRIAEIPNVEGLKQAVGSLDNNTLEILRSCPDGFAVLAGDDAYIVPTILMGAVGSITASAHVCTPMFAAMVNAALANSVTQARTLAEQLLPIVELGFSEPNPSLWKAALHALGEISTPLLRAPMSPASVELGKRLVAAIQLVTLP